MPEEKTLGRFMVLGEDLVSGNMERIGWFDAEDADHAIEQGYNAEPEPWDVYIAIPEGGWTIRGSEWAKEATK